MEIRLVCRQGPCEGRVVTLTVGEHDIGRDAQNPIPMPEDDAAAARHATICVRPSAVLVRDHGNPGGTQLNGVALAVPTQLAMGDVVRIGTSEWTLEPADGDQPPGTDRPAARPAGEQPLAADSGEPTEPRLLVLNGDHRGRVLVLRPGAPVVIGRSPRADLVLDSPTVSREHATFFRQGDDTAVLDNDSSNGVLVNGERIRMIHLSQGDEVQIGTTRLLYLPLGVATPVLGDEPPALAESSPTPAQPPPPPAPPPPAAPKPAPVSGTPIGKFGDYLLSREVGRGGMGRIFSARRPGEEPVALKVVVFKGLDEVRARRRLRRFEREVTVLRRIKHENVAGFRDAGEIDGRPYLAMELLLGPDLSSELRRVGRLPHQETDAMLFQLCAAVSAVHEAGVIHRDLKPANVLLHGPQRIVKLTDFGIARLVNEADIEGDADELAADYNEAVTVAGKHPGTPLYMSPEQVRGEELDMRSDIWALGVILYQLVSGRRPFEGVSGAEVMEAVEHACPAPLPDDVPGYVRSAVYRCLLKPAPWRFASAIELMDALHERRVEQPLPVGLEGPPKAPLKQCPQCRARIAAGRDKCPICQLDLHLFTSGQMLQVEVDQTYLLCCGACGRPVQMPDSVCYRCGQPFQHRKTVAASATDEVLTEAEQEALAVGLRRLKICPYCGAEADTKAPQCKFCGLHLRAMLVKRLHVLTDEHGRDHIHCGRCMGKLTTPEDATCGHCGLDFRSGRTPEGRPWHADDAARPAGPRS